MLAVADQNPLGVSLSSWCMSIHSIIISRSAGSGIIHPLSDRQLSVLIPLRRLIEKYPRIPQNTHGIPRISRRMRRLLETRISNPLAKSFTLMTSHNIIEASTRNILRTVSLKCSSSNGWIVKIVAKCGTSKRTPNQWRW